MAFIFSEYQLGFSQDTWELANSAFNKNFCLVLRIKFGKHDQVPFYLESVASWCQYQFIVINEGSEVRVVTNKEWYEQIESICENEGKAAVDKWVQSSVWTCPEIDSTWCDVLREFQAMVTRWESMLQLGLFTPTVNMTPFRAIR